MTDVHPPISGGCLCSNIRYTISFPPGSEFPPNPQTCQCTMCRKQTGTLIIHFISAPPSSISWTREPIQYTSSPGVYRGFCDKCGSPLTFRDSNDKSSSGNSIFAGTLDGDVLLGPSGKELTTPVAQSWCYNAIPGVTDRFSDKGTKFGKTRPQAKL